MGNIESCRKYYEKNREFVIAAAANARKRKAYKWHLFKKKLKCECGESHPACLDFHHREGTEKLFSVSEGFAKYTEEKVLAEVAKCDVICANCHRKHHFTEPTDAPIVRKENFVSLV
jgi:hypothetical protein